jgi:hypothetical protein
VGRSRLIGQVTKMHELLIFFARLGGPMSSCAMEFTRTAPVATAPGVCRTALRIPLAEPGGAVADSDYHASLTTRYVRLRGRQ